MNKTLGITLGIIGATLLGAAAATVSTVYYFKSVQHTVANVTQTQQTNTQTQGSSQTNQEPTVQSPQTTPTSAAFTPPTQELIQDPGVVWLPKPQKIAQDLKLFKIPDSAYVPPTDLPPGVKPTPKGALAQGITYYKTGTDNGNDIIMATIPPDGIGDDFRAYLRKTPAGTYEYIAQNSDNYDEKEHAFYSAQPIAPVRINTDLLYRSIETQKTLPYKNVVLANMSTLYAGTENKKIGRTVAAQTPYGTLYTETRSAPIKDLTIESFVLVKPNGLEETYQYTPDIGLPDNGVADILWSDGKKNTDTFMIINTTGCGAGPFLPLLSESEIPNITPVGKTSKGDIVYGFSDPNDPIIQFLYKTTGGTYYGPDGKSNTISLKEFQNVHPAFIMKDTLDRWVVYNNSTWGPAVECGKPVIYLYPQQPTDVSVRVDADITKSDPVYGQGWDVNAQPDGTIVNGGKKYDSLFWEGTGHGSYPNIDRGFIVAKKDLETTLRDHLARLGLNQKESNDFLAFWLPKMPKTPFTRLSWLTTRDMNTLAPLAILPVPDTLIRVFLDFEGFENLISIKPQVLSPSLPRNGFTVIEWGGLLRR